MCGLQNTAGIVHDRTSKTKKTTGSWYDENKIMAVTLAGGKANAFKTMEDTIKKAFDANTLKKCNADNHIVVFGHGGRESSEPVAEYLLLGGERVEFDESSTHPIFQSDYKLHLLQAYLSP